MHHYVCTITFLFILSSTKGKNVKEVSPLDSYSAKWKKSIYQSCNTAKNTSYFNKEEKEVLGIMNMARSNPPLFSKTVVKNYPDSSGKFRLKNLAEYKSLLATLEKTKQLLMLYPDSLGWISAKCHAISSGISGYVGHNRQNDSCWEKQFFTTECCD